MIKVVLWLLLMWGVGLLIFILGAGYRQYKYYSKNNKDLFWVNLNKGKFFIYLMFSLILIFGSLQLLI